MRTIGSVRVTLSLSKGGRSGPSLRFAEPSLGMSPSGHSLVVLAALVPRAPVGYPLLSLTRNAQPTRQSITRIVYRNEILEGAGRVLEAHAIG